MTEPTTPATEGAPDAVEYRGKVRSRDRETSWQAASEQTNTKTGGLQRAIYQHLLEWGPMTHDALMLSLPTELARTPSGIRTRTHELETAGWVRAVEDRKGTSNTGRPATLWRAVRDDEPAPIAQPPAPAKPKAAKTTTPDHAKGLRVARRWAQWEIGDPSHADLIIEAYLDPERVGAVLDEQGAS